MNFVSLTCSKSIIHVNHPSVTDDLAELLLILKLFSGLNLYPSVSENAKHQSQLVAENWLQTELG